MQKNNIDVFRRKSGGGCVFADAGCLQFSYILQNSDIQNAFSKYMQLTVDLLKKNGINAYLSGRNDVMIDNHKVAGAAFYRSGSKSILHNTLLYCSDLEMLNIVVSPKKEKLVSKGVASVEKYVGNVCDYTDMSISEFVSFAKHFLCNDSERTLSQEDMNNVQKGELYLASDEFVYGKNPRYSIIKKKHIPNVGYLEAYIELKNNIIQNINLNGDFFIAGDLDNDFLNHLKQVPFDANEIKKAVSTRSLNEIIRNLSIDNLMELLFDKVPHVRKPDWLKITLNANHKFSETAKTIQNNELHTICKSGLCPNRAECWRNGTATFMICGDICTRCCRFCNTKSGKPKPLDSEEPRRIAESIQKMKLKYAVITSVDRDDLPDFGAEHWAKTIQEIRNLNPETKIEVLIPDFQGRTELVDIVLNANPDIIGHNMETVRRLTPSVRRLTPSVRSVAKYEQSLDVLRHVADKGFKSKTGFMVGLGESVEEIIELMNDVYKTGCSILTIGQYLQPTNKHLPVREYISPEQFDKYKQYALKIGFKHVESGPLVRSSYHAERCL